MARLNEVRLYGCIADTPQITKDASGQYVRGVMHLAVVRAARYSGETFGEKDRILFDWPLILTKDPDMVKQMEKYRQYDIIEIKGMFLTRKVNKITYCKNCGAQNTIDGNLCYVRPLFMRRRNTEKEVLTEKQAVQEIIQSREISNGILIVGNLCNDVNYFKNEKSKPVIETAVYQIATDRKYYVKEDNPDNKTDFPIVRSYGKIAFMDSICIHTGSAVLVDGFLHSREFPRKSICPVEHCKCEYEWTDNTTEIVPYTNEYLSDYNDPEQTLADIQKQKEEEAMEALRKNLRN